MFLRQLVASTALGALILVAGGCGSSKPNDAPGLTEAELKKTMEQDPGVPQKPSVMELSAVDTMEMLTDTRAAEALSKALQNSQRLVTGKVLEPCPANSESPYVILDGGTHNNLAYKVKCTFAADEREAVVKVKAGDEIRVEGKCDGVLKGDTLEFTNCVFDSAAKPAAPDAPKP
jgi:hypothetical protein